MVFPLSANLNCCLAPALVAAMVWQIGACPCGCVDHNLWLEMYRSLVGDTPSQPDAATEFVEADDCDHRPRDAFVRTRTAGEDGQSRLIASPHSIFTRPTAPVAPSPTRPPCRNGVVETARFSSAQEMRAHLQVFLI